MTNLILVRHGQSEWNEKNLFTGWKDVELTEKGRAEAAHAGKIIKQENLAPTLAYTSDLKRAQHTLDIIMDVASLDLPITRDQALNERDYGDLTGLNKDDARAKFGEEQVHIWRRSYDTPPPGGESLKDTETRTWPYFEEHIMPLLKSGETVLVAAHGNSLRSIVKNIESMSPEEILKVEIATGVPIFYTIDQNGTMIDKKVSDAA